MLARVRQGEYDQFEVNRGLPLALLVKYFDQAGLKWKIKEELRKLVDVQALNLNGPWPVFPTFDVIFLRNVLIYFDQGDRKRIVEKMAQQLAPDGALFLGGSEIMEELSDRFVSVNLARGRYYKLK
jgi:chemotaxis protein methyltransferase CheR